MMFHVHLLHIQYLVQLWSFFRKDFQKRCHFFPKDRNEGNLKEKGNKNTVLRTLVQGLVIIFRSVSAAELTTIVKNRETWLLLQRTWEIDEGLEYRPPKWKRYVFAKMCCFFLHLKCVLANVLLKSFMFNIKFMFCIFVLLLFLTLGLKICKIYCYLTSKCLYSHP